MNFYTLTYAVVKYTVVKYTVSGTSVMTGVSHRLSRPTNHPTLQGQEAVENGSVTGNRRRDTLTLMEEGGGRGGGA